MAAEIVLEKNKVEWGPVFAGALAAAALSSVLLAAAASIGLSLISAYPGHSYGKTAGTLAAFCSLIVVIGSFLLGGYIAGRLRSPWGEGRADEVAFRDGMHGFLVWSLGIIFSALLAFAAGVVALQAGARVAASAAQGDGALAPATDTLLRTSPTANLGSPFDRAEVTRILATSVANGQMSATDRTYVVQAVAQRQDIPAAEAEKRVDAAFSDAEQAVEKARKAAALTGLVTASALLIGLAAAWFGAQRGGYNRDHNVWRGRAWIERRPQSTVS